MSKIKILICVLIIMISFTSMLGQQGIGIEYRRCTNCSANEATASNLRSYSSATSLWRPRDISSDYDKRHLTPRANGTYPGNLWHTGIDLRDQSHGDTHDGDAIISPENGTITQITDARYKVLVIDGNTHDFGYGHLFRSLVGEQRSGDFVYKYAVFDPAIDMNNSRPRVIINLRSCIAYCEQANRQVSLTNGNNTYPNCGTSLTTTNLVNVNNEVAPLGNSSTGNVHIHMYKYRNAGTPPSSPQSAFTNRTSFIDPMNSLTYPIRDYVVEIATNSSIENHNFSNWGINPLLYSGANTVALRASLDNVNVGDNNSRYRDGVHVLDNIKFYIKEDYPGSVYSTPIKGPIYDGRFELGATTNSAYYPEVLFGQTFGNLNRTGVSPYAYRSNQNVLKPYDNYYFADLYLRISDNDPGGNPSGNGNRNSGPIQYADTPEEARFKDGKSILKGEVLTIENDNFDADYQLSIDNFKPFVQEIKATINGAVIYDFKWETNNGQLMPNGGPINGVELTAFDLAQGMTVDVVASEQMQNLSLLLTRENICNQTVTSTVPATTNSPADKKSWQFLFGDLRSCPLGTGNIDPTGGNWTFNFTGNDFDITGNSGTSLLSFHNLYDAVINANNINTSIRVKIPHRIATSGMQWSSSTSGITEGSCTTHYFSFDCVSNKSARKNKHVSTKNNRFSNNLGFSCCSASEDITLEYEVIYPNGKCPNGGIDIQIQDGVGPYSIEWYWVHPVRDFLLNSVKETFGNTGDEDLYNIPAGTYKVIINDAICGNITQTIELPQGIYSTGEERIIADVTNISSCYSNTDSNDGEIRIIDIQGLEGSFQYSWSGPGVGNSTTNTISNLGVGKYSVTITSEDGCEFSKTFNVCCCYGDKKNLSNERFCSEGKDVFPIVIYEETIYSPANENSFDGEIEIRVYGGTSDNIIRWNGPNGFGSSDTHIRNLGVGEYCITVEDGCSEDTKCFTLVDCSSRNITINGSSINTCQGLSFGSIIVSVQGGEPPYRYSWSNGASAATITNLASDTYDVTVSDKNGCNTSSSYFIDDNIQVRETRNGCVFIYDCNGNIIQTNDIGSYTEVRLSDCRFEDTRCSDGLLVGERFVGTRFDNYNSSSCTVREVCVLTNQTFNTHTGQSRVTALEGFDGGNGCWWCHDVEFCEFPSLNGAIQINNVISNIAVSFVPGNNCVDPEEELHRVFCRNQLIWEGCVKDAIPCNGSLLGLKMEEETSSTQLKDGRVEVRKTYKVIDFDSKLIFDNLKERGLLSKDARLLDINESNESVSLDKSRLSTSLGDMLGIQDFRLKFSPNPFDDRITFKVSDVTPKTSVNLSIFDSFGQVVRTEKYYNGSLSEITKTINLVDLPSGIYFLNISLNSTSITKKMIKL